MYISPTRHLLYVTDKMPSRTSHDAQVSHRFEHLSCFLPGLLALGAHALPLSARDRQLHQWAAHGLAYTCWITYADTETGLGPDEMSMTHGDKWVEALEKWEKDGRPGGVPPGLAEAPPLKEKNAQRDYRATRSGYLLRPEVSLSRGKAAG